MQPDEEKVLLHSHFLIEVPISQLRCTDVDFLLPADSFWGNPQGYLPSQFPYRYSMQKSL